MIHEAKNAWYDHGAGVGGTIIDFVCRLYQTNDISRALAIISGEIGGVPQGSFIVPSTPKIIMPELEPPIVERVGRIADLTLEAYLERRAIPLDLARLYLQEIHYRIDGREYDVATLFRTQTLQCLKRGVYPQ